MAWVRIDDQLSDHPKIVAAGPDAAWLFITGLCYASRYLTDGFIPEAQVRRLSDVRNPNAAVKRLVDNGLWDVVDGGYMIHDYLDYNNDAETVKERRQRNAERQARWRDRQATNASTDDGSNEERNALRDGGSNASTNGPVILPQAQAPIESANALLQAAENQPQKTARSRPPDPIFDTFCDVLGLDPKRLSKTERGRLNSACRDVRDVDGTPDDIRLAAERYRQKWPDIDMTAKGITGNWSALLTGAGAPKRETGPEYLPIDEAIRRFDDVPEHLLKWS